MSRTKGVPNGLPEEVRFWRYVQKGDGCWTFTGYRDRQGYGLFMTHKPDGRKTHVKAHRRSYEYLVGPIPTGKIIMHVCDNPSCVRPDHLKPGTYRENTLDMHAKGRGATGFKLPQTKLTPEQKDEIRRLRANEKITLVTLGRKYDVTPQHISKIVRGER